MRFGALLVGCALCCAACSPRARVQCHFGEGATLGRTEGGRFSGLALVEVGGSVKAILSSREGLSLLSLGSDQEATHLGPECDAGLAMRASDHGMLVACVRRGNEDRDIPGRVLLLDVSPEGMVRSRRRIADVSADPGGVDLLAGPRGPVVAFADSEGPRARAYVWAESLGEDPRLLSNARARASTPRLLPRGDGFVVTWAETFSVADETAGQVWVASERLLRRRVAEISHVDPSPVLVRLTDGLAVGFRDTRRPYRRAGLYVKRLHDDLSPLGAANRVGRANAYGHPELVSADDGTVFALTPHRWDQRDVLVGVHPLGADLERRAPEQQEYEYASRIERARGVVVDGTLMLLTTERSEFGDRPARARTLTLRCQ